MKKKVLTEEQQLQMRLEEIRATKEQEIVDRLLPEYKKSLVGKYFKFGNSYGHKRDWWEYVHVTGISRAWPVHNGEKLNCEYEGYRFCIDCEGKIRIEKSDGNYITHCEYEITEREFNAAWNKMIDKMAEITK